MKLTSRPEAERESLRFGQIMSLYRLREKRSQTNHTFTMGNQYAFHVYVLTGLFGKSFGGKRLLDQVSVYDPLTGCRKHNGRGSR